MKRYCLVGTGWRGMFSYATPIVREYADVATLLAVCDINPKRAAYLNEYLHTNIPVYTDFDQMLSDHRPDTVIVTTKDCAHEQYIVKALEAGCDVITEKPMTIDDEMCANIIETERRTGRKVTVTFNCRFMPFYVKLKEVVASSAVGDVLSVHYEWLLDTSHGADYFRRWHSIRANSGSLLIHKATHHFDLVNWIIDDEPVKVNAFGTRRFYGDNRRPHGERCLTCPYKKTCEFYFDIDKEEQGMLVPVYKNVEDVDGYIRDRCLFSDVIDIEDSVSLNVKYKKGAVMSYSLTAHSPYECMKLVINGTKGRLEGDTAFGKETLKLYDREGQCINYDRTHVRQLPGGHGGSDPALRDNLFRGYTDDPLHQMADTRAGAMSIGIGIAANKSMKEDRAVYLSEFLGKYYPEIIPQK
ncbi:MAG: Gfo/Idh/MocA family oxidoreductase [Clostridia bacterium]|nr:Gfo/Idh/MocA family oxidoreductase [Clostridia bacterium]